MNQLKELFIIGGDNVVFPTRRDIWMGILIWAIIFIFLKGLYHSISQLSLIGIIIMSILLYCVGAMWFYTRYIIQDNMLVIRYGVIKQTIHIQDIKAIRKTTNPFVAPSLSIHRIEINYGKYKTTQISPKDIKSFMKQLEKRNPKINFDN